MPMSKQLPVICPACQAQLRVKSLSCDACETEVSGHFPLPRLAALTADEQQFVLDFVRSSGSLKEMARQMNLSYPTVRNYLDDLISKLQQPS